MNPSTIETLSHFTQVGGPSLIPRSSCWQVGSFVWTHLTNLLETESPHKQAIRDVLENELLMKEFSMDRRKFSRNYELSFFSEKFNLGGVYESNVIWSSNSFIPRFVGQFSPSAPATPVQLVYFAVKKCF